MAGAIPPPLLNDAYRKEKKMKLRLFIPPVPYKYRKETIGRACKWLEILLYHPERLGWREAENCFEMHDGAEVAEIVFYTLLKNSISFEQLPGQARRYLSRELFQKETDRVQSLTTVQTSIQF
jgi:hypothetical protein